MVKSIRSLGTREIGETAEKQKRDKIPHFERLSLKIARVPRLGIEGMQVLDQFCHKPGPAGLVAGAQAGTNVAMEVLVAEDVITPVGITRELLRAVRWRVERVISGAAKALRPLVEKAGLPSSPRS